MMPRRPAQRAWPVPTPADVRRGEALIGLNRKYAMARGAAWMRRLSRGVLR